jgi:GNAT superfamily N-acetyltransferase
MATIRPITAADTAAMVAVVSRMVAGTKFAAPTDDKVLRMIQRPNGFATCAVVDGQIVGFMAGYVGETFLNHEVNAYEQGLYVMPEHRGSTIAVRLVREFEAWARARGAKNIWLGQSVGQDQMQTLHFFERLGYACQGFITCKTL